MRNKPHINIPPFKSDAENWWQTLDAPKRFELMKKHDVKVYSKKAIERIYKNEIK